MGRRAKPKSGGREIVQRTHVDDSRKGSVARAPSDSSYTPLATYLCCDAGALEELKREQAEHDHALKGLKKDKDKATKVR